MTRREFTGAVTTLVASAPLVACNASETASQPANFSTGPDDWIGTTQYVNWQHPSIAAIIGDLSAGRPAPKDRAIAAFYFVRDTVKFGFARGFWDQKASDVLASGYGYCNTKSTLFVALLRGLGLPARQVFVDINVQVLSGLLDPGTPYVDHSYVEAWLDGDWRATDSYIVDLPLFQRAQHLLKQSGGVMGWGVHATGSASWVGVTPTFAQYNLNDPRPLGTKVWGPYADVADFYRNVDKPWNRLNVALRLGMGVLGAGINAKIERVRTS
jgi:hypothetical protein